MIDLVVCSAAESDYAEALSWYAQRSTDAAERFDTQFDRALKAIAADPKRFPLCGDSHHYYLMRHFPYGSSEEFVGTNRVKASLADKVSPSGIGTTKPERSIEECSDSR